MDSSLDELFSSGNLVDLTIADCALITLSDKAFQRQQNADRPSSRDLQWDQSHLGVAFKFEEENPRWHCVWATLEEYDRDLGSCVFRSYDDVYLERLQRSPRKLKSRGQNIRLNA